MSRCAQTGSRPAALLGRVLVLVLVGPFVTLAFVPWGDARAKPAQSRMAAAARALSSYSSKAVPPSKQALPVPYRVIIGGDVLLGRGVARDAARRGWAAQLGGVAPRLRAAELAIVNLESPLARCLPGGTLAQPRLCGDRAGVAALVAAGVDAVTLSNNHAMDAEAEGLETTAALLASRGIRALGARAARTGILEAESIGRIQVVAGNLTPPAHPPGTLVPLPRPADIARVVARAHRLAPSNPVVVILHVGREMDPHPNPRDRAYAEAAVGAGAAAVVMHGAHVRRALVRDRGVPVHLGLGNLRFDQRDARARVGALLGLGFRKGKVPGSFGLVEVEESCVDSLSGAPLRCPGTHSARSGP